MEIHNFNGAIRYYLPDSFPAKFQILRVVGTFLPNSAYRYAVRTITSPHGHFRRPYGGLAFSLYGLPSTNFWRLDNISIKIYNELVSLTTKEMRDANRESACH